MPAAPSPVPPMSALDPVEMPPPALTLERVRAALGDRYALERELGRGGMGAVYLARDRRLDRPVALKVLPPEYAAQADLRERFLRETRTAAGFSHPNVVPVYAVEEAGGLLAYAMGFVEGETLAERVRRAGPLAPRELGRVLQDVGYALAYAHGRGVVHRDVKPDNVMLERATGRALVMDFGISRSIAAPVPTAALTRVGEVVGTPEYMSPEQAAGDTVDGRSDLYALGLTAWFAATGRTAMTGDTTHKVLVRQLTEPVPDVRALRPDLPPALAEAIDRCVRKDPAERFGTAEALVEAIDEARLTEPEIPLPIRLFASEAGTLSLLAIASVVVSCLLLRMSAAGGQTLLDTMLFIVLLGAVVLTRALQTLSEARRLAMAGWSPAEVIAGLSRVMEERQRRRDELRADPETRRRRRLTIRWGGALLVLAAVLVALAFRLRVPVGPGRYSVPLPGVLLVMSGMALLGTSVVLLLRSPFRAPPGERLFRRVWLGPLGRGFLRLATRGAASRGRIASATVPPTPRTRTTAPSTGPDAGAPDDTARRASADGRAPTPAAGALVDARFAALERRVAALEEARRPVPPG